MNTLLQFIPTFIYAVNFIIAIGLIFYDRRRTSSATLAWIMVLFLLPGAGVILYFLFSQNISRYKVSKLNKYEQLKLNDELASQISEIEKGSFPFENLSEEKWQKLITLNQKYGCSYLTHGNSIRLYTDGPSKFADLSEDIKRAEKSVSLEYFIVKPDRVGLELIRLLTEKAREGVQVRLLLDAIGCSKLRPHHYKRLINAGGRVELFFPPKFLRFNWQLNYRNHRKIVVIDNRIGYTGGYNVGLEYLGISSKFTGWRDTHIRVEGECVEDLNNRFILDWRFASKENIPFEGFDYSSFTEHGASAVQIVSCGPDSPETEIRQAYLTMISSAKKSVYIQTPYFVPDESIFEAVKGAALSGVDVRLMIPNKPDHPFVYWATYQNAGALLEAGVKVYIYDRGFLHAKTLVADGEIASVGSANFDIRSFRLSFETNAIIYDQKFARELDEAFIRDMACSRELTKIKYQSRSKWVKFKEAIGRLGSDIF